MDNVMANDVEALKHERLRSYLLTTTLMLDSLTLGGNKSKLTKSKRNALLVVVEQSDDLGLLEATLLSLAQIAVSIESELELYVYASYHALEVDRLLHRFSKRLNLNPTNDGRFESVVALADELASARILFIEPGTVLLAGAVGAMSRAFGAFDRVGIVGCRLAYPDGRLKEAGGVFIDDEKVVHQYLNGDINLNSAEATYLRETSHVSSGAMLVDRAMFVELRGFDATFSSKIFKAADFCCRAMQHGFRTIYQPHALAICFADAGAPSGKCSCQAPEVDRSQFLDRHASWLFDLTSHTVGFMKRDPYRFKYRVLYVDDRTPHIDLGAGMPRSNAIVNTMASLGYHVTILPRFFSDDEIAERYRDISPKIEILPADVDGELRRIIDERKGYYDVLWVSRPHNISLIAQIFFEMGTTPRGWVNRRVIFDTEAAFSVREAFSDLNKGFVLKYTQLLDSISEELMLGELADIVLCVSESEARILRLYANLNNIKILGHALYATANPTPFSHRKDIVFVGSLVGISSPNVDSIDWFLSEVWSLVRKELGDEVRLTLVGDSSMEIVTKFQEPNVRYIGRVDDVTQIYGQARLAIAPTRFAAGIPQKVHSSIAHGVPIVVTRLIGAQIGWNEGEGFRSASWHDPIDFARVLVRLYQDEADWTTVRENGLKKLAAECNPEQFMRAIRDICEDRFTL